MEIQYKIAQLLAAVSIYPIKEIDFITRETEGGKCRTTFLKCFKTGLGTHVRIDPYISRKDFKNQNKQTGRSLYND